VAQPNPSISQILSTTINNYSKEIADNISKKNALLTYMSKRGNISTYDGGSEIYQTVAYSGSMSAQWFNGAEMWNIAPTDSLTTAEFLPRNVVIPVVTVGTDILANSGAGKMHDFVKAIVQNAKDTLSNAIAASLFYSNTENGGKSLGGLQFLVSDNGLGTVGNIDSSAAGNSWWQNVVYSFSGNSTTASKDTILDAVNTAYMKASVSGKGFPDIIVAGATYYSYLESNMQEKQRFNTAANAEAGFEGYLYKGAFVNYDSNCSDTRAYVLNTNYLHYRPHKDRNCIAGDKVVAMAQDASVLPILFTGGFTISGRQNQAVIIA
jgi:hypothetical protein